MLKANKKEKTCCFEAVKKIWEEKAENMNRGEWGKARNLKKD